MGGTNSTSSNDEIFHLANEDSKKYFDYNLDKNLIKDKDKIIQERNGDIKYNLTIRIYSDKKCPEKYKNYLKSIKMDDWKIIFLDNCKCIEETKKLIEIYKQKAINKKFFDEVLVILIDSFDNFISMVKDSDKDFLKDFNNNLINEEQPFFFFINKNDKDFEYFTHEFKTFRNFDFQKFKKQCIDFIKDIKDSYNIKIIYKIKFTSTNILISFLKNKKSNKDNFNIVLENGKEFIYNNKFIEEDEQQNIHELIEKENNLIIKN